MDFNLCKPHYHSNLLADLQPKDSECLDSREEYLQHELNEMKLKYNVMQNSMRWWADCTANWREKWYKMQTERNKLLEEICKYQEVIQNSEIEKKELQITINNLHHSSEMSSENEISHQNGVESRITMLQDEVKRLSGLLDNARMEMGKITELSSGNNCTTEDRVCNKCRQSLLPGFVNRIRSDSVSSASSSSHSDRGEMLCSVFHGRTTVDVRPLRQQSQPQQQDETPSCPVNIRWRRSTGASSGVPAGGGGGSSMCVQTGCSRSSTMDGLSQREDDIIAAISAPCVETTEVSSLGTEAAGIEEQMVTLSRQIVERLPRYESDRE